MSGEGVGRRLRSGLRTVIGPLVVGFIIVVAWQVVTIGRDPINFPHMAEIARRAPSTLSSVVQRHLLATVAKVVIAYAIGTVLGVLGAVLVYRANRWEQAVTPWVDFFRSLPGTATFPFFSSLWGPGDVAATLPSTWVVLWITLFAVHRELKVMSGGRSKYLKRYEASWWFVFRHVHWYTLRKALFGNAQACVSLALAVVVAMEMLVGNNRGIGFYISDMNDHQARAEMIVGITIIGILGYAANSGLRRLEGRMIYWQSPSESILEE